jgi:manganese efflux pump family protein
MGVVALIVWLATAGAGLYLLAIWLIEYDRDFQSAAATRLPIPVISGHAVLAVSGLVVWGAYLLFDNSRLAWAAVIILGAVAVLGLTMAVRWLGVYRTAVATTATAGAGMGGAAVLAPAPAVPPERNFPVAVVVSHGIFAVVTLALVVLTALGAWGS